VTLSWENASAKDYTLDVSSDKKIWTTIATESGMPAGARVDTLTGLNATARFVRVNGTARTSTWGYSLYEMEVNGTDLARPPQILTTAPGFGYFSNRFGFEVQGVPGQVMVIEATTNLITFFTGQETNFTIYLPGTNNNTVTWLPIQATNLFVCLPVQNTNPINWWPVQTNVVRPGTNIIFMDNNPSRYVSCCYRTRLVARQVPRPGIAGPVFQANQFNFGVAGIAGESLVVETSTNLIDWTPVATNVMADNNLIFTDTPLPASGNHFYRARAFIPASFQ